MKIGQQGGPPARAGRGMSQADHAAVGGCGAGGLKRRGRRAALACAAGLTLLALSACQERPAASGWSGYAEGEYLYLSAPVAGTLTQLPAQRGQPVAAGALLFQLDDTLAQATRAEAEARVAAAQAQASNGQSGRRTPELAQVQAQLTQAQAAAQRAQADLQRQQALVAQGFISTAKLDEARAAATQAEARVAELRAALRSAEQPLARPEELGAARASTQAAEQVRAQAVWRQQQARQSAPAAGVVAEVFFRVGEYVPAGQPVLALLPPGHRKARFYVPERELGGLALGQPVHLHCDGCGADIPARISHIAPQAEYTPPVIYSNAQRAKLVFLVEARPEPAHAQRLHPGQPLDVYPVASGAPATPATSASSTHPSEATR